MPMMKFSIVSAKPTSKGFHGIRWNLGIALERIEMTTIALETMKSWGSNYLDDKRDTHDFRPFKRDTQIPPNFTESFARQFS
jgi:hypothetical protein